MAIEGNKGLDIFLLVLSIGLLIAGAVMRELGLIGVGAGCLAIAAASLNKGRSDGT